MPLLRNGQWADKNPWIRVEDDSPLPDIKGWQCGVDLQPCTLYRA